MERRVGAAAPASFADGIANRTCGRHTIKKANGTFAQPRPDASIDSDDLYLSQLALSLEYHRVSQIGSGSRANGLAALIFTHASGMVNAIVRGVGIAGARPAGTRRSASASFPN